MEKNISLVRTNRLIYIHKKKKTFSVSFDARVPAH